MPHVVARRVSSPMNASLPDGCRCARASAASSMTTMSNCASQKSLSGAAAFSQKFGGCVQTSLGRWPGRMSSAQSGCANGSQCWNSGVGRSAQN